MPIPLIIWGAGAAVALYAHHRSTEAARAQLTGTVTQPVAPDVPTQPKAATINPEDGRPSGQNVGTKLGSIPTPTDKGMSAKTEEEALHALAGMGYVDEFFGMAAANPVLTGMSKEEIAAADPTKNMTADEKVAFRQQLRGF